MHDINRIYVYSYVYPRVHLRTLPHVHVYSCIISMASGGFLLRFIVTTALLRRLTFSRGHVSCNIRTRAVHDVSHSSSSSRNFSLVYSLLQPSSVLALGYRSLLYIRCNGDATMALQGRLSSSCSMQVEQASIKMHPHIVLFFCAVTLCFYGNFRIPLKSFPVTSEFHSVTFCWYIFYSKN